MSENLNRDFSKYEAMETKELEEILRLDAEAPEGAQTDTELLLYILEVLASRNNTESITENKAQKAWESFERNYMPEEYQNPVARKKSVPWLRRLAATAAAVALLIVIPFSTKALTLEEIMEIFAQWAKETFSFVSSENTEVSEPVPDDGRSFSSLQEMLQASNRDASIVPTWIPDGFVLDSTEKIITPAQETYVARYVKSDRAFRIRVQNYLDDDFQKVETSQEYSEIYSVGNQDYYIFHNNKQNQAIWIRGSYECIISGNLSIDEMKLMIDSIEKG
jgi:hypothetical protein